MGKLSSAVSERGDPGLQLCKTAQKNRVPEVCSGFSFLPLPFSPSGRLSRSLCYLSFSLSLSISLSLSVSVSVSLVFSRSGPPFSRTCRSQALISTLAWVSVLQDGCYEADIFIYSSKPVLADLYIVPNQPFGPTIKEADAGNNIYPLYTIYQKGPYFSAHIRKKEEGEGPD